MLNVALCIVILSVIILNDIKLSVLVPWETIYFSCQMVGLANSGYIGININQLTYLHWVSMPLDRLLGSSALCTFWGAMILSIMTFCIKTLSIIDSFEILSITSLSMECHYAECSTFIVTVCQCL